MVISKISVVFCLSVNCRGTFASSLTEEIALKWSRSLFANLMTYTKIHENRANKWHWESEVSSESILTLKTCGPADSSSHKTAVTDGDYVM